MGTFPAKELAADTDVDLMSKRHNITVPTPKLGSLQQVLIVRRNIPGEQRGTRSCAKFRRGESLEVVQNVEIWAAWEAPDLYGREFLIGAYTGRKTALPQPI